MKIGDLETTVNDEEDQEEIAALAEYNQVSMEMSEQVFESTDTKPDEEIKS